MLIYPINVAQSMKLSPFTILISVLLAVDILLTAILSLIQPEITLVRTTLSTTELAALVLTMTVVVWRVFRSF